MTITIRKVHLALGTLLVALLVPAAAYGVHVFDDVEDDEFYSVPVEWAAFHGITTGRTPTTFEPMSPVTRGEAVTFEYRYDASVVQPALEDRYTKAEADELFDARVRPSILRISAAGFTDDGAEDSGDFDYDTGLWTFTADSCMQAVVQVPINSHVHRTTGHLSGDVDGSMTVAMYESLYAMGGATNFGVGTATPQAGIQAVDVPFLGLGLDEPLTMQWVAVCGTAGDSFYGVTVDYTTASAFPP